MDFQDTIAQKVFSFWGHIRVQYYETTKTLISEETPIKKSDAVEKNYSTKIHKFIKYKSFATKSCVIEKK
jgi:lipoprotein-releasing system permease protein